MVDAVAGPGVAVLVWLAERLRGELLRPRPAHSDTLERVGFTARTAVTTLVATGSKQSAYRMTNFDRRSVTGPSSSGEYNSRPRQSPNKSDEMLSPPKNIDSNAI